MLGFIWSLIIGGLIGWIAGMIVGKDVPFGIIGNIIAGFIGAWLGSAIMGNLGPEVGGFAIVPALIGAVIFVFILSLIFKGARRAH
ncbi:MAG: GlsB/YeaQ/YmgE family stress response membrane protein [Bacillus sp. (in: firmicutes)]